MDKQSKNILKNLYESYLVDTNMAISSEDLIEKLNIDYNTLNIKIDELESGRYLIKEDETFDGPEIKITQKGIRLVKSWE